MATRKRIARKSVAKGNNTNQKTDLATKAANAVAYAISQANKGKFGKNSDGKVTVHVHIGDVIMMGFDEAVDAEEWGVTEKNTEIISGKRSKSSATQGLDADGLAEKNRKISRSIRFKKGALELDATERSQPARKTGLKGTAHRASKRVSRKNSR
jgi:hypothetical protein